MIEIASLAPTDAREVNVVHVTADYPDAICGNKTPAIRHLVELVDDKFNQHVISLNRISPSVLELADVLLAGRSPIRSWAQHDNVTSVEYAAPGLGVLHETMLLRLADALCTKLAALPRPDLLVAHKLTVEGLAVALVARRLGVPYAVMLQGNTDVKIVRARLELSGHFADVLRGASVVFAMAPWAISEIQRRLKVIVPHPVILPCPIAHDSLLPPASGDHGFATAFHLRNFRLKNFARLCKAFDRTRRQLPDIGLTVFGGGSTDDHARVAKIAGRYQDIALAGPVLNRDLPDRFNRAVCFVLPSLRETFGMVFVEALFAGCPVIYPVDRAIHGYFGDKAFALPVEPRETGSIAEALARSARDEPRIKAALAQWHQSDGPMRFRRTTLRATFAAALTRAAASCGTAGRGLAPAAECPA